MKLVRLALLLWPLLALAAPYPPVLPGIALTFPRDEGSHPEFRTEWWYATGWLEAEGKPVGFQVTFFRSRLAEHDANPSNFAPRQILFAHAALSDPAAGAVRFDERAARAGFGLAYAEVGRLDARIGEWSFRAEGGGYRATIPAKDFRFDFVLVPTQPPLLNGEGGVSRKGPRPESASFYYSRPHLEVSGTLTRGGRAVPIAGTAWLDHEWSSEYLAADARGWDWTGINLDDGGALMAFRIRDSQGGVYWAGGTYRSASGAVRTFGPDELRFIPRREWRSPKSGAAYPVALTVVAGDLELHLDPLLDDQEIDARLTTGTVYWEGAVTASRNGNRVGRGYLELTGYRGRLRM